MASEQSVVNVMGRAMWDPHPTKTDLQSRQLAAALGYPSKWRVVRSIEPDTRHIVDRIYSNKPGSGCDTWFNHAGAMEAAAKWDDPELCNQTSQNRHIWTPNPSKGKWIFRRSCTSAKT